MAPQIQIEVKCSSFQKKKKSFRRPTGSAKGLLVPWNLTAAQAKTDS